MKNSLISKTIVPDNVVVSLHDKLLSFVISSNVPNEKIVSWLHEMRCDKTTVYPFVIFSFDIDGPLFIESEEDLHSYADMCSERKK